jgi:transcriptional regulator with GAF, ATPase, and Fis domain
LGLGLVIIEDFPELMLTIAAEREPEAIMNAMVRGIAQFRNVVLSRVWIIAPGDICAECPMRPECPDQTRCLHLCASAGNPADPERNYSKTTGRFRRFPIGVRKIGQVAATGKSLIFTEVKPESEWVSDPGWIVEEDVQTVAAQPLIYSGEVLGVLAVFDRKRLNEAEFRWLRIFADHGAIALANARAFEQIEELRRKLEEENEYLREEVESGTSSEIVGSSPALRHVLDQISLVGPTDATVLIQGESGSGKELVARAIHECSSRKGRPMVKVNCGAIPETLFESEFFGHVRGSFTGALRDRMGRFETADGGTLFLDEVSEIPLALQPKLLRVLQEGTFERVGEDRARKVNVRVVAATNRDLRQGVETGGFRSDLYFRLSVFPIFVPPLRDRREDIPALAQNFANVSCRKLKRKPLRLAPADTQRLQLYDWPGNVRELQHVIERAVILSKGRSLELGSLEARTPTAAAPPAPAPILTREALRNQERANIETALRASDGRVFGPRGAAQLLGMKPTTLASRIRALRIRRVR